jgi:hypothetical protein
VPYVATFAIPGVRARRTDVVSRPTVFVRTVPAVRVGNCADQISFVMIIAGRAIPVVGAISVRCKNTFAGAAETIPCTHAYRNGRRMYHVASRVTPQVIAKRVSVINPQALRAEPSIVADNVNSVPVGATRAPP